MCGRAHGPCAGTRSRSAAGSRCNTRVRARPRPRRTGLWPPTRRSAAPPRRPARTAAVAEFAGLRSRQVSLEPAAPVRRRRAAGPLSRRDNGYAHKGVTAPPPGWIAGHRACEPETRKRLAGATTGHSFARLRGSTPRPGCGGDAGVRRGPAAVRSLAPHRLALTAVVVTAILAATMLSGLASFSATVTNYAVRETLATSPATGILITSSVGSAAAAARDTRRMAAALHRA